MDSSEVGRYGTISLLKQQDPSIVITAFGIDTEQLTFGRDRQCGVRLYYPDVDPVHCKIVFDERKAFLIVLGQHGLLIDGCLVYPSTTGTLGAPTTIPLANNSEIEIHGKLFRFTYPPKELRAALFASPIRTSRAPRLSMINSAQVFSPRLSQNPKQNLRVLQSPLRGDFLRSPFKPSLLSHGSGSRSSSPVKQSSTNVPQPSLTEIEEESDAEDIILVEGNHPQIVEEEKDLVILEDVKVSPIPGDPTSSSASIFSAQHHAQFFSTQLPQTPSRARSNSRNSLHRALLVRSVRRAVRRAEKENEDEMEEMEVLSTVASDEDFQSDDMYEHGQAEDNFANDNFYNGYDWNMEIEKGESTGMVPEGNVNQAVQSDRGKTPKYHERVAYSTSQKDGNYDNLNDTDPTIQSPTIATRKNLGAFMTPQPPSRRQPPEVSSLARNLFDTQNPRSEAFVESEGSALSESTGLRFSVGGGAPRRMLVEMPWRVKDLVIPFKAEQHHHMSYLGELEDRSSTSTSRMGEQVTPKPTRRMLGEQERKAIQERRRSALRDTETFFIGGIPGMGVSPTKNSTSPIKQSRDPSATPRLQFPPDDQEDKHSISLEKPDAKEEDIDDEVDTRSLLERMKVTVEEMKRRRSTMLVPQAVPDAEKGKVTATGYSLHASTGTDENIGLWGETEMATQKSEATGEKHSSNLSRSTEQGGLSTGRGTREELRETSTESSEEIDGIVEKSFSQLMRHESPVDIEQSSDDIQDILLQDITIPSGCVHEPTSSEVLAADIHLARIGTRSCGRTAFAETEPASPARRDTRSNDDSGNELEQNSSERAPGTVTRRLASEMVINAEELEPANTAIADQRESEEEGHEVRPKPVPRAKRGRSLRAVPSAPARRTRTTASVTMPKATETTGDSGEEPLNGLERRTRATTTRATRTTIPKGKGRARKVKEESDVPVAAKDGRTKSVTVAVDGRKSFATAKTPVTRASGRRTPATAPSEASMADEREIRDKENPHRSHGVPQEGIRVKMTRNRKTAGPQVSTASKTVGATLIKVEENEEEGSRRNTRARARTKTQ